MFLSCLDWLAVERVYREPLSASNSLYQGKIQGIYGVTGLLAAVRSAETPTPRQSIRAPCVAPFFENRELTGNLPHSGRVPTREFLNFFLGQFFGLWVSST